MSHCHAPVDRFDFASNHLLISTTHLSILYLVYTPWQVSLTQTMLRILSRSTSALLSTMLCLPCPVRSRSSKPSSLPVIPCSYEWHLHSAVIKICCESCRASTGRVPTRSMFGRCPHPLSLPIDVLETPREGAPKGIKTNQVRIFGLPGLIIHNISALQVRR